MKNSKKHLLIQLAIVFAIFANAPYSQAELVIQIYYQSHQLIIDEQPTTLIDPNLTMIVGDEYLQTKTHVYHQYLDSNLTCGGKRVSERQQGINFSGYNTYQSNTVNYQQLWPTGFWAFLQPNTINCQYNWQIELYQGEQLTPLLLLDNDHTPILQSEFTIYRQ